MSKFATNNPYLSPIPNEEICTPKSWTVRRKIAAIVILAISAAAIYFQSPLGVFLPAVIGVFACIGKDLLPRAILTGVVLAYSFGVATIAIAITIFPKIYPPMVDSMADDAWLDIEARIYATAGLVGASCGAWLAHRIALLKAPSLSIVYVEPQE